MSINEKYKTGSKMVKTNKIKRNLLKTRSFTVMSPLLYSINDRIKKKIEQEIANTSIYNEIPESSKPLINAELTATLNL
jgi:hypothetical protein